MKAVVYEKNGSKGQLVYRDVEKPVPGPGQVLVKIVTVSLNAGDYRSMQMGSIPKRRIFGSDIAGTVEAVGEGAGLFKTGDEVAGDISGCGLGGLAEYVAVPEQALARKPAGVSFQDAAALPMAAVTALKALRKGSLRQGQKVLIYGAGGGVGTFAVQLARHLGAEVTAVCGPKNVELVRSLGAQRVVDYTREDIFTSGSRFDLVVAVNGSQPLSAYRGALKSGGMCVVVGGPLSQVLQTMVLGPLLSLGSRKLTLLSAQPDTRDLAHVLQLAAEGKIKPVIERSCPLEQAPEAMETLARGHARGKVVIAMAPAAG